MNNSLYHLIIILILAILFITFFLYKQQRKRKIKLAFEVLNKYSDDISSLIALCKEGRYGKEYVTNSEEEEIRSRFNQAYVSLSDISSRYLRETDAIEFMNIYSSLHERIKDNNVTYTNSEKEKYNQLLSDIDGKSLDDQQRDVVVCGEDRCLVVAGAGSGKTLTISAKVKYLCEAKGIKPEDILLISFTRKAAQEMTERIKDKLGYNVQATTFHKLGLDILKEANQRVYDVNDDMRGFFEKYLSSMINNDKELLNNLITFFAYYLHLPSDLNNFDSLGEVYQHEKSIDLETIKSKYSRSSYIEQNVTNNSGNKTTLKQEKVKSLQEVEIANYLFLHGIRYEYEYKYPFQDLSASRKAYHPDFYLPDYDIYLEHFGVNENNKCPWLSPIEEKKYVEDMMWKKEFHKQNGTKLLCTYSYYFSKGELIDKLEELLINNGVIFKEIDLEDVFDAVYKKSGKKYFSEFITLCSTFTSLFKSNGYQLSDLDNLQCKSEIYNNRFFKKRLSVFTDIIKVLLVEYEKNLVENNAYDFSDMINLSTKVVKEGFRVHPYKYVIVDEFQDISVARYKLIKAILDQTGAKLLCVGDDWQSIYRFAGSDINLFTSFEEYFGSAKTMYIEKTYRNSQQLINDAGAFIMMNPKQIKKSLISEKTIDKPIAIYHYYDNYKHELKKMLDDIINEFGRISTILILGRTVYDFEIIKNSELFYGKDVGHLHYIDMPEVPISFMTIHKAKGLEADNVILLNFENSILGFPNKIADDPMLETVLSESDNYLYAEERRLLYVALTRTKNKAYILCNDNSPSEFKNDFVASNNVEMIDERVQTDDTEVQCPKCKTGHLVKRINEHTGKEFIGCSNYPKCDYIVNSTKAVENRRVCPNCGGFLSLRPGRYGAFYGCSNYPNCTYTEEYNKDKFCPNCGNKLYLRKGKYGLFWGCSNYPSCKYIENVNSEEM